MWKDEKQTTYRRTKDGQHGDLLDCLVYMVRNLRRTKDPKPYAWGIPEDNVWVRPNPKPKADWLPDWRFKM